MRPARPLPLLVLALSLAACSRSAPAEPTPAVAATAAPPPPPAAAAADPASAKPDETLFGLLGVEAQSRPKIAPNADDVYAALEKAGYAIGERRQSLGRTYKAAYCTGAYTKDASLAVDVCEYPDEASARAGLARARELFPSMANRMVFGRKGTLLTVINQKGDAAADARAKKIAAVYMAI